MRGNYYWFAMIAPFVLSLIGYAQAAEPVKQVDTKATSVNVSEEKKELKTFLLDQQTRQKIDKQREAYLKPVAQKKANVVEQGKAKKKGVYIPPKVEVSAIIVKPDGSSMVRVNKKFDRSPRNIQVNRNAASLDGVPVTVKGKTQIVPVGSTLLTRQEKLVKTYKLEQAAKRKEAPKTKQVAVKERLEDVQKLQPK